MKRRAIPALLACVLALPASAGIVEAPQTIDPRIHVIVKGDGARLGVTPRDQVVPLPAYEFLHKLLPGWLITWRTFPAPTQRAGWTRGTAVIEVLDEYSRATGLYFYVDADNKSLVVDRQ